MTHYQSISIGFSLGAIVITPGVCSALEPAFISGCLGRHLRGDWGHVCAEDAANNNAACMNGGGRILSAYAIDPAKPCKGWGDNSLWIITEADRSATTFLLPQEY